MKALRSTWNWVTPSKGFLLLVVLIALRLTSLIPDIIDDDEAWFAVSAASLTDPLSFFSQTLDNKPPGTVWFYWAVGKAFGTYPSPVPVRGAFLALLTLTALSLREITNHFTGRRSNRGWLAASLFVIVSVLPSPKLFAVTNEGLMTFFISTSFAVALRFHSVPAFAAAGALFACALLVKQTAALFLIAWAPLLFRHHRGAVGAFAGALCTVLISAVSSLGVNAFWFWTYTYPKQVLAGARGQLFSGRVDFLMNSFVFFLGAFPVVSALRWKRLPDSGRSFLLAWFVAAVSVAMTGNGLFLHYFIPLTAPLSIMASLAGVTPFVWGWRPLWLGAAYAASCYLISFPLVVQFWGVDLGYYRRVAQVVQAHTERDARVLVWSGSAATLALAERRHMEPFVTARFAAGPYSTPMTLQAFEDALDRSRPAMIVDLHVRGDNQFNLELHLWLYWKLRKQFHCYVDPGLPWVRFFLPKSTPPPKRLVRIPREGDFERIPREFRSVYSKLFGEWNGITEAEIARFWDAPAFDVVLRSWIAMLDLARATPQKVRKRKPRKLVKELNLTIEKALRGEPVASTQAERLKKETLALFESAGFAVPLALSSPAFWISYSIVQMQPVADKAARLNSTAAGL